MKKILILGETSQLGRTLNDNQILFNDINLSYLNLRDFNFLDEKTFFKKLEKLNLDIIINFTAYTKVDDAEKNQDEAIKINELLINKLINFVTFKKIKFIHFSTDYVFDGNSNRPYLETDPKNPLNFYGKTKSNSENLILRSNTSSLIFRISGLYSKFGKNFVKTIISKIKNNQELNIVFDQFSSPTNAEDVISMLSHILKNNFLKNLNQPTLYHFTNEGICSWFDIAQVISTRMRFENNINKIDTQSLNLPAKRPIYSKLNCDKIKNDFNLKILDRETSLNTFLNKIIIEEN